MDIFDTHTHLDLPDFDEDREEVIERAQAAGVTRLLCIGATNGFEAASRCTALAEKYPFIWASAGIHPHDVEVEYDIDRLRKLASHERVCAVGETGLDFFRDWSPRDRQEEWFKLQIDLALELDKPIIIHSREAGRECLETLKQAGAEKVGGVFHCYQEDAKFAAELREINFLVSIPGTLTFKKAEALREAVRDIPLEQLMLETDAPYMAPTPYRGKRCESAYTLETAKKMAEVKGITLEEVAEQTTANAIKLFKLEK